MSEYLIISTLQSSFNSFSVSKSIKIEETAQMQGLFHWKLERKEIFYIQGMCYKPPKKHPICYLK